MSVGTTTYLLSADAKTLYPALASLTDAQIETFAKAAVRWIKAKYGRDITPGWRSQSFSSHYDSVIWLPDTPVRDVCSIKINGTEWKGFKDVVKFTAQGRLFLTQQYTTGLQPYGQFWNQIPGWQAGLNNIQVKYLSGGCDQADMDTYVGAVVNWFVDSNSRSPMVSSENIGDYSYVMNTAFSKGPPASVTNLLSGFMVTRAC